MGDINEVLRDFQNIPIAADNMAQMTSLDFMNLASKSINRNYDGNPLALDAFINSIELLSEFCHDAIKGTFFRFVKSKLEGKAFECIKGDSSITTVDAIVAALQAQIKPDNSKVIEGRMLALKPDRNKLMEFSQQTENLAEALQRSLIIEGIPQAKAKEMTIEKTIELCRNSTRSDLVKSVLAASQFSSPKEVVAKYLVEKATEIAEKQILSIKQSSNKNLKNFRQNRYNNNNNRGGRSYNGNNNGNQNNFRGRRGNRYNGRGGNNSRNYNNGNRGNGQNNYGNRNNNNDRYNNIRFAENFEVPQPRLGDAENRN